MGGVRVRTNRGARLRRIAGRALRFPFDAVLDFLVEDRCALCQSPPRVRRQVRQDGPAGYFAEAAVPVRCLRGLVGVVNHPVCASCAERFVVARSPGVLMERSSACAGAAETSADRGGAARPLDNPDPGGHGPIIVFSPFMTTDETLRIIHLLKFNGYLGLADPVGRAVAWALRRFAGTTVEPRWVVPTPMDERSKRRRGFNQAELIARVLAAEIGAPVAADVLRKTVRTRRQSLTPREMRQVNVRGAFSCPAGASATIAGCPVVLVDDLVTSGSTAEACARALFGAGAASVSVACFGRAL